ncbi:cardiolipin-specific deacylase [Chloropicon primus]|uniref:Cardiolipin-specific deacylase n=1 Tax=Chloropicon primus TaxID=1764295 RepID=A0A5B8MM33_9CHLO|nr:cardiolipin-specific deacylase [Chloropicon primus]UPQ99927.1 cardiolipin-specific deacylase [Chloropicon primus]|mmetsp:Transcript_242/g.585  ORF Transcript_242/g.585 Transcript_242/m.585 type:complete len:394 (+) Transcript_242:41-1222(+)|eukprot:QDZ20715.1 cardiolipin-specific deacylase [Chloropicon primus]
MLWKTLVNGALLGTKNQKGEELSYLARLWVRTSSTKAFDAEQRLLERFLDKFKSSRVYIELENYGVQYIHTYSLRKKEEGGEKPIRSAILFTHGFGGGSGMFYHVLQELSRKGFEDVFAIDWLGMGRSSRPSSGLMSGRGYPQRSLFSLNRREKEEVSDECIDFFVESLEKWREEMKIAKLQLVGHSLGGYLSTRYALAYPERVERLVLLSPVGVPEPEENENSMPDFVKRNRLFTSLVGLFWSMNLTPQSVARIAGPWGPELVTKIVKARLKGMSEEEVKIVSDYLYHINVGRPSGELALNALLVPVFKTNFPGVYARRPLAQDLINKFPRDIPLTFLFGDRDWMLHPTIEDIVASMPNAEVRIISNTGHHVYLDNPPSFKRIMTQDVLTKE